MMVKPMVNRFMIFMMESLMVRMIIVIDNNRLIMVANLLECEMLKQQVTTILSRFSWLSDDYVRVNGR